MTEQTHIRKIIHVDMDAFYASVEQRDDAALRGKPVVVGGKASSRGVVAAASYEARRYGIHSAMPMAEALRRCPQAVVMPVNMRKYAQVSAQIHDIFHTYTPLVEPLSLDEAFLDVTGSTRLFGPAEEIALTIKRRIREELQLTASVGLACNKFVAKIASDIRKPDGYCVVEPERIQEFLDPLPVGRIWGVGKVTAEQLARINIKTVQGLRSLSEAELTKMFGIVGSQLYELARGIDDRPVESEREVKSIGRETTFDSDIGDRDVLQKELLELAVDIGRRLRRSGLRARTVTIKARYPDFVTLSRSHTMNTATDLDDVIYHEACVLLDQIALKQPLRLLGLTASNLTDRTDSQPSLFDEPQKDLESLAKVVDAVNQKYGKRGLTRARLL